MVLATKQHTVTIVDSEEFSNARNGLTGTGITNAAKGSKGASGESIKLSIEINEKPVRTYMHSVCYHADGSVEVIAEAIEMGDGEVTEYDVTLTLGVDGWHGTATLVSQRLID